MRIIFLNTWHGKVWEKLKDFLAVESGKTDIFCFMEVDPVFQNKLENSLKDYSPIYNQGIKTKYLGGVTEGRSIFVKKTVTVESQGSIFTYRPTKNDAGGCQYAELTVSGRTFFVGSVHGKAQPGTKGDTSARLNQSMRIINFFKDKNVPKIIGGDFNLYPDTKSVAMFEDAGYKNLIKEFDIKNTRNKLSWEHFGNVQYFADYCFVSPDIHIKNFEVPDIEVSDHLPLILDFEI